MNITASSWVLDMATFSYSQSPLSATRWWTPKPAPSWARTDALGKFRVKDIPPCGVVAITGLSAIPVGEVKEFTAYDGVYVPPPTITGSLAARTAGTCSFCLSCPSFSLYLWP
jgi:hypothetical protein